MQGKPQEYTSRTKEQRERWEAAARPLSWWHWSQHALWHHICSCGWPYFWLFLQEAHNIVGRWNWFSGTTVSRNCHPRTLACLYVILLEHVISQYFFFFFFFPWRKRLQIGSAMFHCLVLRDLPCVLDILFQFFPLLTLGGMSTKKNNALS